MNTQLIIVIIIGIVVAAIIVRGICRFFTRKSDTPHCPGCSGGCDVYS